LNSRFSDLIDLNCNANLKNAVCLAVNQFEISFVIRKNNKNMPWYNGDYPPSYKNQPKKLREKAVEIANEVLKDGADEGVAIATGLKRAREYFKNKKTDKNGAS